MQATAARIHLIGCSGCGKSTLGAALASHLGVRFCDLDDLYWEPDWREVGHAELARRLAPIVSADAWVIAGNYHKTTERIVWPRVTQLVMIDLPLPLLVRRIVARSARRAFLGEPCCNGNRETLAHALRADAPLRYTLRVWRARHARMALLPGDPRLAHAQVTHLRSAREVRAWRAGW
ncbi:MAG TPA: shikimate kinase [Burkholderiaceae bacterium]|nr:shikimate kinase [Burkholderiaceae bacterium]